MRDFYDIYMLLIRYGDEIDIDVFKEAFQATCKNRKGVLHRKNECCKMAHYRQ